MAKKPEIRQRRSAKKKESSSKSTKTSKQTPAPAAKPTSEADDKSETLWETFSNHPLTVAGLIILIPYMSFHCFYYFSLKRPDFLQTATLGLVSLRPAVHLSDTRPLLIVGSMGSGTRAVSAGLSQILDLEMAHESTDAEAYFTRDGTVSSWLGLRFQPRPAPTDPLFGTVLTKLCLNRTSSIFHPKFYRPSNCSLRQKWSDCWKQECIKLVGKEWGCALVEDSDDPTKNTCLPPFGRILHQVQHPVQAIQELMAKVCPGARDRTPHPGFSQLAGPFIDKEYGSCLEIVSWYVINFSTTMIKAQHAGYVHGMYQYENVTLCDIVNLGGFFEISEPEFASSDKGNGVNSVVYPPVEAKLVKKCHEQQQEEEKNESTDATTLLPRLASLQDERRKLLSYTWDDFSAAGGEALKNALRDLCTTLGYDPDHLPTVVIEKENAKEEVY